LKRYGGLFLFYCNYVIKDLYVPSLFYSELLQWWSEFLDGYDTKKEWQQIVWNNKDIRINNKPVFYGTLLKAKTPNLRELTMGLSLSKKIGKFSAISQDQSFAEKFHL